MIYQQSVNMAKERRRLLSETRQAYEFSPNSYTNSAFHAAMALENEFNHPDWIAEFTEYCGFHDE